MAHRKCMELFYQSRALTFDMQSCQIAKKSRLQKAGEGGMHATPRTGVEIVERGGLWFGTKKIHPGGKIPDSCFFADKGGRGGRGGATMFGEKLEGGVLSCMYLYSS